jgi:hypothetical protein
MPCDPNHDALDHLAARVSGDPYFLAPVLASYQQRHGLDDAALASVLGSTPAMLTQLRLCRRPGAAEPSTASPLRPPCNTTPKAWPRRVATLIPWALPLTTLALIPKCPACVAAYVLLFTGIGLSLPAATAARWTLVVLSIAALAYLLLRAARRAVTPPPHNMGATSPVSGLVKPHSFTRRLSSSFTPKA